jgi:hypothetical protein
MPGLEKYHSQEENLHSKISGEALIQGTCIGKWKSAQVN